MSVSRHGNQPFSHSIKNDAGSQEVYSCDSGLSTNCVGLFLDRHYSQKKERFIIPNTFKFKVDPISPGETTPLLGMIRNKRKEVSSDIPSLPTCSEVKQQEVQSNTPLSPIKLGIIQSCDNCRKSHLNCDVKNTSSTPCSSCCKRNTPCTYSKAVTLAKKKKLIVPSTVSKICARDLNTANRHPAKQSAISQAGESKRIASPLTNLPTNRVKEIVSHNIKLPFYVTPELQSILNPIDAAVYSFADPQTAAFISSQEDVTRNPIPQKNLTDSLESLSPLIDIYESN